MLLYDIFHRDGSFSDKMPLPEKPSSLYDYAVCANGERRTLYADRVGGKLGWYTRHELSDAGRRRHAIL